MLAKTLPHSGLVISFGIQRATRPFDESFPRSSILFPTRRKLPQFLLAGHEPACPWPRADFAAGVVKHGDEAIAPPRGHGRSSAHFMVQRLQEALPKMLADVPVSAGKIRQKFEKVARSAQDTRWSIT
jgi:hypothetical protein